MANEPPRTTLSTFLQDAGRTGNPNDTPLLPVTGAENWVDHFRSEVLGIRPAGPVEQSQDLALFGGAGAALIALLISLVFINRINKRNKLRRKTK